MRDDGVIMLGLVGTREERMPKHLCRCSLCHKRVQIKRLAQHQKFPECYVPVAMKQMHVDGWARAPGAIYTVATAAGFPVTRGPIGWFNTDADVDPVNGRPHGKRGGRVESVKAANGFTIEHGWWARFTDVKAITTLAGHPMPMARRVDLLKRMVADPVLQLRVEAVYRLNKHARIPGDW